VQKAQLHLVDSSVTDKSPYRQSHRQSNPPLSRQFSSGEAVKGEDRGAKPPYCS